MSIDRLGRPKANEVFCHCGHSKADHPKPVEYGMVAGCVKCDCIGYTWARTERIIPVSRPAAPRDWETRGCAVTAVLIGGAIVAAILTPFLL